MTNVQFLKNNKSIGLLLSIVGVFCYHHLMPGWVYPKPGISRTLGYERQEWDKMNTDTTPIGIYTNTPPKEVNIKLMDTYLPPGVDNKGKLVKRRNIQIYPLKYAGVPWEDKLHVLRHQMKRGHVDVLLSCDPAQVAWLFNLRNLDELSGPLFQAAVLVTATSTILFVEDNASLPTTVRNRLINHKNIHHVVIMDLSMVAEQLHLIETQTEIKNIWLDHSALGLYRAYDMKKIIAQGYPLGLMKSVKNKTELGSIQDCLIMESAKLVEFVAKLENMVKHNVSVTELSAIQLLEEIRRSDPLYMKPSFATVSAVAGHAADLHYTPTAATDRNITNQQLYLLDTGGHYIHGTTDIARTFHFGVASKMEKIAYTRVLMASIDVTTAVWLKNMTGRYLDKLARRPLQELHMDFPHASGHGVGMFNEVHEDAVCISSRLPGCDIPLQPGMTVTCEPGYYEVGKFGIRLENVLAVEKYNHDNYNSGKLQFNILSLVPFEPNLIDFRQLNSKQKQWLNQYNDRCRQVLGPILRASRKHSALTWLYSKTIQIY